VLLVETTFEVVDVVGGAPVFDEDELCIVLLGGALELVEDVDDVGGTTVLDGDELEKELLVDDVELV
jgi:hypothetical protein